jgi:hypothetical protein
MQMGQQTVTATAMPMATATATATAMPMATATAMPMATATATATGMPMATGTAMPMATAGMPMAIATATTTPAAQYNGALVQTYTKQRGCIRFCLVLCPLLVMVGVGLFIPAFAISSSNVAAAMGPRDELGEAAGLQQQPSDCTITAIYHRPIVNRHLAHTHHPHHPHSPQGRRMFEEDEEAAPTSASPPPTVFEPPTRHLHAPQRRVPPEGELARHPFHDHSPPSKRAPPPKTAEAATTKKDPIAKEKDDEATAQATANAPREQQEEKKRVERKLGHRLGHWVDICYDRFVFAFEPSPFLTLPPSSPAGENLGSSTQQMANFGWREIGPATAANSTTVVLSTPLNLRECAAMLIKLSPPNGKPSLSPPPPLLASFSRHATPPPSPRALPCISPPSQISPLLPLLPPPPPQDVRATSRTPLERRCAYTTASSTRAASWVCAAAARKIR